MVAVIDILRGRQDYPRSRSAFLLFCRQKCISYLPDKKTVSSSDGLNPYIFYSIPKPFIIHGPEPITAHFCLRFAIFHHGGTTSQRSSCLKGAFIECWLTLPGWAKVLNVACFEGKGQDMELLSTSDTSVSLFIMFSRWWRLASVG